jgi:hypothetical protein
MGGPGSGDRNIKKGPGNPALVKGGPPLPNAGAPGMPRKPIPPYKKMIDIAVRLRELNVDPLEELLKICRHPDVSLTLQARVWGDVMQYIYPRKRAIDVKIQDASSIYAEIVSAIKVGQLAELTHGAKDAEIVQDAKPETKPEQKESSQVDDPPLTSPNGHFRNGSNKD